MGKKVGIITFVNAGNYGAELQAFASQFILNKMGYEAEIINYVFYKNSRHIKTKLSKPQFNFNLKQKLAEFLLPRIQKLKAIINKKQSNIRKSRFEEFHRINTKFSKEYRTIDELYLNPPQYDIYISGSDQIWNPDIFSNIEPYFLTFAPKVAKKISYASSFGKNELSPNVSNKYSTWLKEYYAISTRENIGVKIINDLNLNAECVLDPTLLLDMEEWQKVEVEQKNIPQNYLLIYELISSPYLNTVAKEIAKNKNLKIVRICKDVFVKEKDKNVINIINAGPAQFIYLFSHADYIVTNSFHGTAFSINFNKNFNVVIPPGRSNSNRQRNILTLTNLEDRLIEEGSNISEINSSDIDYKTAMCILDKEREKSILFLKSNIDE